MKKKPDLLLLWKLARTLGDWENIRSYELAIKQEFNMTPEELKGVNNG